MENEKRYGQGEMHLYKTKDNTLIQVYEDKFPDLDNEEQVMASDEDKLLWVNVMGEFPDEIEVQDCGHEYLDEPIKDYSDIEEVSSKIPYEIDTYLGTLTPEEYKKKVPEVVEMWRYAGYDEHDVEIRDMSRDYSDITLGVVGSFNADELYDELKEIHGYCYQNDFADRAMDCLRYDMEPWQLDVVREKLTEVYDDIENIKEHDYER